jgi:PAS domain S-box-containing protein
MRAATTNNESWESGTRERATFAMTTAAQSHESLTASRPGVVKTHVSLPASAQAQGTGWLGRMLSALIAELNWRERSQRDLDERDALRRRAEHALERQKHFTERLIEATQAIVLVVGGEGRVMRVNSHFERITGHSAEQSLGRDWVMTYVLDEFRECVRDAFAVALDHAASGRIVAPLLGRDGRVRYIEWHYEPLASELREPDSIVAVGREVTRHALLE